MIEQTDLIEQLHQLHKDRAELQHRLARIDGAEEVVRHQLGLCNARAQKRAAEVLEGDDPRVEFIEVADEVAEDEPQGALNGAA